MDLNWSPFVIRIHNLPLNRMTQSMALIVGDRIGRFLELLPTPSSGAYQRLKAKLDVRKPLPRIIKVRTDLGNSILLHLSYEKLSNYCYNCGLLDHTEKYCPKHYINITGESPSDDNWQYGPSL